MLYIYIIIPYRCPCLLIGKPSLQFHPHSFIAKFAEEEPGSPKRWVMDLLDFDPYSDELPSPSSHGVLTDAYMDEKASPDDTSSTRSPAPTSTMYPRDASSSDDSPQPPGADSRDSQTASPSLSTNVAKALDELSRQSAMKRLGRLMRPRVDGSLLVPKELVDQYKDPNTKEKVIAEFIGCGGVKDPKPQPAMSPLQYR